MVTSTMENLIEPIRFSTSLFALVTVAALGRALRPAATVLAWLLPATAAALFLTHVTRGLPTPMLLPLIAGVGTLLGAATLFSPAARALFDRLDDGQWRTLMSFRSIFGALLLASAATDIMPMGFALPAGLGDMLTGALAVAMPGSLADGPRAGRLLVFGIGIVDFANVVFLIITVAVPWLAATGGLGISLMLPWVAVPLLATLNLHGLRLALTRR